MKMIWAVVRYTHLERVEDALSKIGQASFSVTRVRGLGEEHTLTEHGLVSHLKVEILVPNDRAERVRSAIVKAAWSGLEGDGLIAVLPVEGFVKIREVEPATLE